MRCSGCLVPGSWSVPGPWSVLGPWSGDCGQRTKDCGTEDGLSTKHQVRPLTDPAAVLTASGRGLSHERAKQSGKRAKRLAPTPDRSRRTKTEAKKRANGTGAALSGRGRALTRLADAKCHQDPCRMESADAGWESADALWDPLTPHRNRRTRYERRTPSVRRTSLRHRSQNDGSRSILYSTRSDAAVSLRPPPRKHRVSSGSRVCVPGGVGRRSAPCQG